MIHQEPTPALRPMTHQDLDEIAAMECRAHAHPRPRSVFADELDLAHAVLLVLELGTKSVGFMDYWEIAGELELLDIVVDPAYQGRGFGRFMVRHLVSQEASRVLLEVAENNSSARRLYAAAGFVEVGRRARYYRDGQAAVLYDWSAATPSTGGSAGAT